MLVLSAPAIYSLELTSACNNNCPGCSNVYAERTRPPLSASIWETWLASLAPEAVRIRLTGGEPTLHPGFFRILDAATSYDAWVTIFTNGRWANPSRFVRRLLGRSRLSGLLVSLHGACAESHEAFTRTAGSFDETVTNVRRAIDVGVRVAISTIITRYNWDELEAVAALGQEWGVDHVAFNRYLGSPLPDVEPTVENMRSAMARVARLVQEGAPVRYGIGLPQCFALNESEGCPAGVAYAVVDPWGNLRPCAHSPTVIGSLRERSLAELWHSPEMDAWRALMPPECTTCAAYAVCHGGCRAIQELRPDGRDPLRRAPLAEYAPPRSVRELPADVRPRAALRMRLESFGYALLGQGQVLPVRAEARPVIEACDGRATFAELAARFGQGGLDLLGELWELGMLDPA